MTLAPSPERMTPHQTGALEELTIPLRWARSLSLEMKITLLILAALSVWGIAVLAFGVAALVWPMKFIVPGIIAGLVLMTWGQI